MNNLNNIYLCNKTLENSDIKKNLWKKLNPKFNIHVYDDNKCIEFLKEKFNSTYVDIFNFLKDGPIKSDFWRICILYKHGGVYSDLDNVPYVSISDFLEKDIDFCTSTAYFENLNFNPNFIFSKKNNSILKKCIDIYIKKYFENIEYNYWEFSIMTILNKILKIKNFEKKEGIYEFDNNKIQLIIQNFGNNFYDSHHTYKNRRLYDCRDLNWDCNNHKFINNNKNYIKYSIEYYINLLKIYKSIYKNIIIPKNFIIPENDLWPKDSHNLNLYNQIINIENMRHHGCPPDNII